MVISRSAFGFFGNILPAGLNAVVAGIGWFAVNSISGALALHSLVSALPKGLCLVLVVAVELAVAFFGHNLVQAFERYAFPVLTVIFVVVSIWVLTKAHPGAAHHTIPGGFLVMLGATFGYAAGWNPYAADYTRYLAPKTPGRAVGLYAGLGVFASCVLLETAGAAAVTATPIDQVAFDPSLFTNLVPTWIGKLTLLAVVIGAISANALNMYSGSISFMTLGLRLPTNGRPGRRRPRAGRHRPDRGVPGHQERRQQLRELPADHLLLDRAVAGRGVRRLDPAARHQHHGDHRGPHVPELGRPDRDVRRRPWCRSGCSPTRPSTRA